ncbi:MAG: gas vesicle protein K [Bacteroidota bacterium]
MDAKLHQEELNDFLNKAEQLAKKLPEKINSNPENAGNGLVKLVLTLVNLIRELMEKQAIKRMESGSLTEEEIERVGLTFMKLEEKMEELKTHFNLEAHDLQFDLGFLEVK